MTGKKNRAGGSVADCRNGRSNTLELQDIAHFRQIADNLQEVIALSNADITELFYVNRAYQAIWGRGPETLYAHPRSFLESVHKDDREKFDQALEGLIKQGIAISDLECRVIRPDGSITWVSCGAFPVLDSQGQIYRLVGSAQQITERKLAEEQLRQSEDRYRDLVEHSHDLICTHDPQGILLSVNEAPLRILGYSREELLNKPLRDFVPPEARHHCDAYLSEVRRNGLATGLLPVLTKSGELRFWEFKNSLRTEGVSSPIVRGLAHDVTDQKRAQEQLQRSEAILAEGQKLTHTGSWIWNPVSGEFRVSAETARIVESEPTATEAGLELFLRYVHQDDRPAVERSFNLAAVEKRGFAVDYRIVGPNGPVKYIHGVGRPVFKASGKFVEFIGTVMDVSERTLAEAELRRLTSQLLQLHDEERRKIARDLHDTTAQNLAAVSSLLSLVRRSIRSSKRRKSQKLVTECQALANQCLDETRTLSYVLFPPMLDRGGLKSAIRHYVSGFIERTGIRVKLEISSSFKRVLPELELALFRVAQESLVNIQRHSQSRTAKIRLDGRRGSVSLEVIDQGRKKLGQKKGELAPTAGVGIASMIERVKHFGGALEIESSNVGVTVRARVPISES